MDAEVVTRVVKGAVSSPCGLAPLFNVYYTLFHVYAQCKQWFRNTDLLTQLYACY